MKSLLVLLLLSCIAAVSQVRVPGPGGSAPAGAAGPSIVGSQAYHTASSGTTFAFNYTATGGNRLAVGCVSWNNISSATVTDSASNSYTAGPFQINGNNTAAIGAGYASNITGGSLTITCTWNASSLDPVAFVLEFSGGTGGTDGSTSFASITAGTAADSGTIVTLNANDFLVGMFASNSGTNPCTMTAGGSSTMTLSETNTGSYICSGLSTRSVTSIGTYSASATVSSSDWAALIIAFK